MQGLSYPGDSAIRIRSIRCNCHDGHVCLRGKERVVYLRVCIRLHSCLCVWFSSRSVAFRSRRSSVVRSCRTSLVAQSNPYPKSYVIRSTTLTRLSRGILFRSGSPGAGDAVRKVELVFAPNKRSHRRFRVISLMMERHSSRF
jgi:hypothetical protein